MCVVSAIMDYGRDQWPSVLPWAEPRTPVEPHDFLKPIQIGPAPAEPDKRIKTQPLKDGARLPTAEEITEFLKLVEVAKEFDRIAKQPHCEDPEKIKFQAAMERRLAELERTTNAIAEAVGAKTRLDLDDQDDPMLYGSSILNATYEIGGKTVQLGTIVLRAYEDAVRAGRISSASEWNEMAEDEREQRLFEALILLRKEARG